MTTTTWTALIGLLSVASAVYLTYQAWRSRVSARGTDVVTSAISLLAPYKEEVAELRKALATTMLDLNKAQQKVKRLSADLSEAQVELGLLRTQVRDMRGE